MMKKILNLAQFSFGVVLSVALTGCVSTYTPPADSSNTAKFVYSNSQNIEYRADAVNCAKSQTLPTEHSAFSVFTGGDAAEQTTTLPAGQLVTLAFDGASIPMPQLNSNNQIASTALSLLTKGKQSTSVSADSFKKAAQSHCSFMVSFVPERGAFYRYKMGASNVGTSIGSADYQCYINVVRLQDGKWVPTPVLNRVQNQGGVIVNGMPGRCSAAGFETELQQGNLKGLPLVNTISNTFNVGSGSSNGFDTSIS